MTTGRINQVPRFSVTGSPALRRPPLNLFSRMSALPRSRTVT